MVSRYSLVLIAYFLFVILFLVFTYCSYLYYYSSTSGTSGVQTTTQAMTDELSSVEVEDIKYMAEEEKLAYDVYT